MLKNTWVRRTVVTAAMLLTAAVSMAAEPEVLTKVPADAYGLVVINNVRTLSSKISNAATRLNIPVPPDLAGYFTRRIGISKGFDANGSAALVLLKPSAERQAEGYFSAAPPAVLLVPTSDPTVMLQPFEPGEADKAGIRQVTLPDSADKGYAAVVDNKWIALAQSKEDLAAYLAHTDAFTDKASAQVRRVFDINDLVIWGNVPKLSVGLDKTLDDFQTDFAGMLDLANVTANQDPLQAAMQKQGVGLGFAFVKEFLKDADSSMLTVRLTDSGATLGMVGDFKSDSTIGKFVASQQGKTASFEGLMAPPPPGNGFLAAASMNWDPASVSKIMGDFTDKLISDPAVAKDPRVADLKKVFEVNKQMYALMTGMKLVFLDPPAEGKGSMLNGMMLIETSDPAKFRQLQLEALKSGLANQGLNPDIKQTVTTVPDAATVKDVKLTRINVKMALRDATPDKPISDQARMGLEVIKKLFGPDGLSMYVGTIEKRVIVIYGSDGPTLEAAVTAAQNNNDSLTSVPAISAIKDQAVSDAIAVAYLPVARWMALLQTVLMPQAAATAPSSPTIANAPPVVLSAGVNGNMMTAEIHVPIATVQGAMEAIQRIRGAGAATPKAMP